MLDSARESIEDRPKIRQNLISQETPEATDACHAAQVTDDQDLGLSQASRTLRKDKEQHIKNLAVEVEGHLFVNDLHPVYQIKRKITQNFFTNDGWISPCR